MAQVTCEPLPAPTHVVATQAKTFAHAASAMHVAKLATQPAAVLESRLWDGPASVKMLSPPSAVALV